LISGFAQRLISGSRKAAQSSLQAFWKRRIYLQVSGQALKLLSDSERNRDGGIAVPHHLGSPTLITSGTQPQARTAFHSL
jgi:hypothetical protein